MTQGRLYGYGGFDIGGLAVAHVDGHGRVMGHRWVGLLACWGSVECLDGYERGIEGYWPENRILSYSVLRN